MTTYQEAGSQWGAAADTELAGVRTDLTLATSQLAVAEAEKTRLIGELAADALEIERLKATIRRLKRQLNEQEPAPTTVWGSSTGKHTYDYFTQQAGKPLAARRSYEGYARTSIIGSSAAADVGRCVSVNSVAFNPNTIGVNAAKVEAYLRSFPADHPLFFIVSHEPENPKKGYVAAEYVKQQQVVRGIVDDVNTARVVPILFGGNWMAYSARERDMSPWYPGSGVWDFHAWDGYAEQLDWAPAETFDAAVAFNAARNLPFAVAETGIDVEFAPADRVVWIESCQQYAKDNGAAFWCYWDGSFSTFWLNTPEEFKAVVEGP